MNVTKLLFKACIILVCMIYGQRAIGQLNKTVRVPVEHVDVEALGDIITRQTGLILSFNSQKIGARQQVRLRKTTYTIQQLLTLIKDATDADYTIYKEHVIFHRKVAERPAENPSRIAVKPVKKPVATPVKQISAAKPVANAPIPVAGIKKAVTGQVAPPLPLVIHPVFVPQRPARPVGLVHPTPSLSLFSIKYPEPPHRKQGLFSPFAQAGIAGDETFYFNAEARAGITLLYAIGGWSSNFSVSHFRYGLGTSYPLARGWRIRLEATTGRLSSTNILHAAFDTITNYTARLDIKSTLHRVSLFAEKSIGRHWAAHAGPVFNYLKSSGAFSENLAPLIYYLPGDAPVDDSYHIIKPPYTFSRSTSDDRLVTISKWIGIQAGVCFSF